MRVGCVVVTFRRPEVLTTTLTAVTEQTWPLDRVVVVDNDADPEVHDLVSSRFPGFSYLANPGNLGYGAGLARGMRHLRDREDPDWFWLLDDDSPPAPSELACAMDVAQGPLRPDVVGGRGGRLSFGRVRHDLHDVSVPTKADFTLVDGALVSKRAVEGAGYPREDLFLMQEDLEYTTRIAATGARLVVRPSASGAMYLGAGAPWRGYYQTRNHLRIALDRRSPSWVFGALYRLAALTVADVRHRRWTAMRLRWRGAVDGVRGRMGRTLEPG